MTKASPAVAPTVEAPAATQASPANPKIVVETMSHVQIAVETNDRVGPAPEAVIASEASEIVQGKLVIQVETFTGPQPGVNWKTDATPAPEAE